MHDDLEHFVVVTERDCSEAHIGRYGGDPRGPIVWETYLGQATTREGAEARARSLGTTHGWTRVARLVFEPEGGPDAAASAAPERRQSIADGEVPLGFHVEQKGSA